MIRLKELIDGLKGAPSKIQEKINHLKTEREQLLTRLEEINSLIQIVEENLIQIPKVTDEKKAEMTAEFHDLSAIRGQKKKVILGSAAEDNRLIAETDAIRLDTLNAVRAILNL